MSFTSDTTRGGRADRSTKYLGRGGGCRAHRVEQVMHRLVGGGDAPFASSVKIRLAMPWIRQHRDVGMLLGQFREREVWALASAHTTAVTPSSLIVVGHSGPVAVCPVGIRSLRSGASRPSRQRLDSRAAAAPEPAPTALCPGEPARGGLRLLARRQQQDHVRASSRMRSMWGEQSGVAGQFGTVLLRLPQPRAVVAAPVGDRRCDGRCRRLRIVGVGDVQPGIAAQHPASRRCADRPGLRWAGRWPRIRTSCLPSPECRPP